MIDNIYDHNTLFVNKVGENQDIDRYSPTDMLLGIKVGQYSLVINPKIQKTSSRSKSMSSTAPRSIGTSEIDNMDMIVKTDATFKIVNIITGKKYERFGGNLYDNIVFLSLLASNVQVLCPDMDDVQMVKRFIHNQFYCDVKIGNLRHFEEQIKRDTNGHFQLKLNVLGPLNEMDVETDFNYESFYANHDNLQYILYYLAYFTNLNIIYSDRHDKISILVDSSDFDIYINLTEYEDKDSTSKMILETKAPPSNCIGRTFLHKHNVKLFESNRLNLKVAPMVELNSLDNADIFIDLNRKIHGNMPLTKGIFLCITFENEFRNGKNSNIGKINYMSLNLPYLNNIGENNKMVYFNTPDKQFAILYQNYIQSNVTFTLSDSEYFLIKPLPYPLEGAGIPCHSGIKVQPIDLVFTAKPDRQFKMVHYNTQNLIQILSFYDQSHLYNGINPLYLKDIPYFSNNIQNKDWTIKDLLKKFPAFEKDFLIRDNQFDDEFLNSLKDYFDIDLEIINLTMFIKLIDNSPEKRGVRNTFNVYEPSKFLVKETNKFFEIFDRRSQNLRFKSSTTKSQKIINERVYEFAKENKVDGLSWSEPSTTRVELRNKITLLVAMENTNVGGIMDHIENNIIRPGYYLVCQSIDDIFLKSV